MEKDSNDVPTKSEKKLEKRIEKELLYILGFFGILIIVFLLASAYFKSLNHFTYEGLQFTKQKFGELPVYHYYYYYETIDGKLIQYNLYLQNDPRTNNVSVSGDRVSFEKRLMKVTIDSSYPETCRDNLAGYVDLVGFLRDNQLTVQTGFANETFAEEQDQPYITCDTEPASREVVLLRGGDMTEIVVDNNCHEIIIGPDCQVRQAIEKFKLEVVLEARAKAGLSDQ